MRNDILIVSIIAVVILALVSFTGVVGYQTTKSSTIAKASPLFSVRTSSALDKESKDLTCDYVGKGEESVLSIPKRDGRTASFHKVQRIIDIIRKMDDKTFKRFIGKYIHHNYKFKNVNFKEITSLLYLLRAEPDEAQKLFINEKSNRLDDTFTFTAEPLTIYPNCVTLCNWAPGCYLIRMLDVISFLLWLILYCGFTWCNISTTK